MRPEPTIPITLPALLLMLLLLPAGTGWSSEQSNTSERFRTFYEFALLSSAAYQDESEIRKHLQSRGYTLTSHDRLPGYGVGYYLATNDELKHQVVAIRGTSNVENAVVDAAFTLVSNEKTGVKLHQGFARSTDYLYDRIKSKLKRDYRVDTTGHSLGGAVALILAMYLDATGYEAGKIITFGQPKVTNVTGSRKYAHLDVTRLVTPRDMVPLVPPLDPMELMNMEIYWHQGKEIVLQEGNAYSELEGRDSMMRATDFLNEMLSQKNLQHHMMSVYIDSIRQKLAGARRVPYENDFSISDWFGGLGQ